MYGLEDRAMFGERMIVRELLRERERERERERVERNLQYLLECGRKN